MRYLGSCRISSIHRRTDPSSLCTSCQGSFLAGLSHLSSILSGDTLVPNIEYSILYKEYNLTRFNHKKNTTHLGALRILPHKLVNGTCFFGVEVIDPTCFSERGWILKIAARKILSSCQGNMVDIENLAGQ